MTLAQCLQLCDSQGWAESTKDYYRRDIYDFARYWEAEKGQISNCARHF